MTTMDPESNANGEACRDTGGGALELVRSGRYRMMPCTGWEGAGPGFREADG
jgi:hypothetical protein